MCHHCSGTQTFSTELTLTEFKFSAARQNSSMWEIKLKATKKMNLIAFESISM